MNDSSSSNSTRQLQRVKEASFVILDFETVTPAGRPPEPLELAAMRIAPGPTSDQSFRVSWLIKPPEGAPLTDFDTRQTGIRWQDIQDAPDVAHVLREFDTHLQFDSPVLVAHNARYDIGILQRFARDCPHAASLLCIDTMALAKHLVPQLSNYKLDTLAQHFSLPIPQQRHRGMPDVLLTVQIFLRLIDLRLDQYPRSTIDDLLHIAGVKRKQEKHEPTQMTLF